MQVESEKVSIETPGGAMPARLARPANGGPLPAVIVVQEAFGLNPHIEGVAARLAAEGYVALAPDLFHRGGAGRTAAYDDLPKALTLMGELNDQGIVEDMGAAIGFLEKQTSVRADRIGVTGFCMGGRVTYLTACALPGKIAAAAPFYGGGIPIDRTASLQAPVLAFFGEDDPFIPLDQVRALEAEAKRVGKSVEVVIYPGAPHGFFCDERDSYRPDAAADSWKRLLAFFARHLKA
jgi:carboxymethylenebutenolidase